MSTARSVSALRMLLTKCRNTRKRNKEEIRRLRAQLATSNKRMNLAVKLINTMLPKCERNLLIDNAIKELAKSLDQRGRHVRVTKPKTEYSK